MKIQTNQGDISDWIHPIHLRSADNKTIIEVGYDLISDLPDDIVIYNRNHPFFPIPNLRFFHGIPKIDNTAHADTVINDGLIMKAYVPYSNKIIKGINEMLNSYNSNRINGRTLQEFNPEEYEEAKKPWKSSEGTEHERIVIPSLQGVILYRLK
ncbi:MAG: hypothetical protein ACMXYG_02360 [Candidatus Woesearchaeota archaeon]